MTLVIDQQFQLPREFGARTSTELSHLNDLLASILPCFYTGTTIFLKGGRTSGAEGPLFADLKIVVQAQRQTEKIHRREIHRTGGKQLNCDKGEKLVFDFYPSSPLFSFWKVKNIVTVVTHYLYTVYQAFYFYFSSQWNQTAVKPQNIMWSDTISSYLYVPILLKETAGVFSHYPLFRMTLKVPILKFHCFILPSATIHILSILAVFTLQ